MMSFEEFTENVVKEIRAKVGGAFQIKEHNVIKNNNVKRAGIAVMKNEEDIGPCAVSYTHSEPTRQAEI